MPGVLQGAGRTRAPAGHLHPAALQGADSSPAGRCRCPTHGNGSGDLEPEQGEGVVRHCPDCGSAMGPEADASYRICQGCYDAYVDHAGR